MADATVSLSKNACDKMSPSMHSGAADAAVCATLSGQLAQGGAPERCNASQDVRRQT